MDRTTASTIQPLPPCERTSELQALLDNLQQEMHKACGVPPEWLRYPMPGDSRTFVEVNFRELERRLWGRMLQEYLSPARPPMQYSLREA